MKNQNLVDYLVDDNWLEEDTYLRVKSIFSGYDSEVAFNVLYEMIHTDIGDRLNDDSYTWNYLRFLTDRSITAGRNCNLTYADWTSMLTVDFIVKTYELRDWASVELILDGQSPGDEKCLDEMEHLGYHLDALLDHNSLPLEDLAGVPFESTEWHDKIAAPILKAMTAIHAQESSGFDVIGAYRESE